MASMTILEAAASVHRRLLAREEEVAAELADRYGRIYRSILRATNELQNDARGGKKKPISRAKVQRMRRYKELTGQLEGRLSQFAAWTSNTITLSQEKAVKAGLRDAKLLTDVANGSKILSGDWNRVPVQSLDHLIGTLMDGSPLRERIDRVGADASAAAQDVLTNAVARGTGPRETGRLLSDAMGEPLNAGLTIARTEQLRSYRSATLESYRANSDVVQKWQRYESLDGDTCAICVEEYGRIYEIESDFESHPNCRGTLLPYIEGAEDQIGTGESWFVDQPEETQLSILGPSKFEAWQNGRITLSSLNERTYDERWGYGRRERSLADAEAATRDDKRAA